MLVTITLELRVKTVKYFKLIERVHEEVKGKYRKSQP